MGDFYIHHFSLFYLFHKPFPSLLSRMLVHRTENAGGLPYNVFLRKQTPITGVLRGKHIVANRKIIVLPESIFLYYTISQTDAVTPDVEFLPLFPLDGFAVYKGILHRHVHPTAFLGDVRAYRECLEAV